MKPMTIDVKSLVRDDDLSKEALQRFIDKFAVHAVMPLKKLIVTTCGITGLTDAEVREELAAQGIDLDAEMAKFRPKLDDLMRARAVRLALAAVKANPARECSPLPWANDDEGTLYCRSGYQLGHAKGHARHIVAAVNAAPVLAAEVERNHSNLLTQAKRAGLPVEQLKATDLAEHLADRVLELEAVLAAVRVAVERMHERECCAGCGEGGNENAQCYTDAVENDAARTAARGAVGLEEGK